MRTENIIPKEITKICRTWKVVFYISNISHYVVGVLGTISAVLVTLEIDLISSFSVERSIFTITSSISIAILTFIEPKKIARAYVRAWRLLHEEMGLYHYGETNSVKKLFNTVRKGEEIISKLD